MNKAYKIDFMGFNYKGYNIVYNIYGINEYTVQYCGDEYCFETEKDAESFIDTIQTETKMEYREVLERVDVNNIKEYAKALLVSEELCLDCDPILIEEFWVDKVREFLKNLAKNA